MEKCHICYKELQGQNIGSINGKVSNKPLDLTKLATTSNLFICNRCAKMIAKMIIDDF